MIVKIQRPLNSNLPIEEDQAYIYNKSRSYSTLVPLADVIHLFKNGEPKVYHKAKITGPLGSDGKPHLMAVGASLESGEVGQVRLDSTKLLINRRVDPQDW